MNFDSPLMQKAAGVRVLVVGDVMLDQYYTGDTQRISPEAPIPVVKVEGFECRLGGAANVARNLASLGAQVGLLGMVGNDGSAEAMRGLVSELGIKAELLVCNDLPTITKTRVISRGQQILRLDEEEKFQPSHAQSIRDAFEVSMKDYDCIVFSDYEKGTLRLVTEMIALAKDHEKPVLVDPKAHDFSIYRGATVITPNRSEFVNAGGVVDTEANILQSASDMLDNYAIYSMVLTRSEQGMSIISASDTDGQVDKLDLGVSAKEISDVTGAGDTVIATLAIMTCLGENLAGAARYANVAAGLVVSRLGAAAVTLPELVQAYMTQEMAHSAGPGNEEIVKLQIMAARQNGERIVFTNGCFDILHAGHIAYLEEARKLGDRLVLGLNTDSSISRLKGSDRPVNSLQNRRAVLRGLRCVDWILCFGDDGDDTPLELISEIRPDVLVKGGDYQRENIVGADLVESYGGVVAIVDLVEGLSTTNLISKIKK